MYARGGRGHWVQWRNYWTISKILIKIKSLNQSTASFNIKEKDLISLLLFFCLAHWTGCLVFVLLALLVVVQSIFSHWAKRKGNINHLNGQSNQPHQADHPPACWIILLKNQTQHTFHIFKFLVVVKEIDGESEEWGELVVIAKANIYTLAFEMWPFMLGIFTVVIMFIKSTE